MNQCPVLLDSGACVPMSFLISAKALEQTGPGLVIDQLMNFFELGLLPAANGSPIDLIEAVDSHFHQWAQFEEGPI